MNNFTKDFKQNSTFESYGTSNIYNNIENLKTLGYGELRNFNDTFKCNYIFKCRNTKINSIPERNMIDWTEINNENKTTRVDHFDERIFFLIPLILILILFLACAHVCCTKRKCRNKENRLSGSYLDENFFVYEDFTIL